MDKKKNDTNNIQDIQLNIISEEFGDNDSLTNVIKIILECMPSAIGNTTSYIENNPIMLDNMKIVSQHIMKRTIMSSITIEFLIKLIRIYTSTYQYDNAKEIIDFISFKIGDNKLQKIVSNDDVIAFEILKGRYFRDKRVDLKTSLNCFKKAVGLLADGTHQEIKYLALAHYAYTMMKSGQVKNAIRLTLESNKLFLKDMSFLPLYLRINTEMYLEQGEDYKVLENLFLAIDSYDTKSEKRRLFEYIPLIETLTRLKKFEDAKSYLDKCLKLVRKEDLFTNNKQYIELLVAKIKYNIAKKNIKYANEDILLVEEMFLKVEENFSKYKVEEYKAEISVLKGDVEMLEYQSGNAINLYVVAENILLGLYDNTVEKRKFAELYEKIVMASISADKIDVANKYYMAQRKNFANDHAVTKSIRRLLEL